MAARGGTGGRTATTDAATDQPVTDGFDATQRPGYLMRRGVKHLALAWAAAGLDMTVPQFAILVELDQHPGLDQRTLGERVLIDPSTTADMCRRLLARGDLERTRDPADQRRYIVRVTAAGRAALAIARPLVDQVDEALLDRLTPAEQRRFLALFRKALALE